MGNSDLAGFLAVAFVISQILVPLAATATTPPNLTASRKKILAAIGLIVGLAVLQQVSVAASDMQSVGSVVAVFFLVGLVVGFWACRTAAARCQDVGWSRWLALLMMIPFVNLIFLIVLACVPPNPKRDASWQAT